MTHPIESTESAEVRRALDRLQQTLEELGDRYREVRRERKLFRERIEELERLQQEADASAAARAESATQERRRVAELEERALLAEKRHSEFFRRISELEHAVTERESLIADQEDAIQRLRSQNEEEAARFEQLQAEIASNQEELARMHAELERAVQRAQELESTSKERDTHFEKEEQGLRTQLADLHRIVDALREERGVMEEKYRSVQHELEEERARSQESARALQEQVGRLETALASGGASAVNTELEEELRRIRGIAQEREVEAAMARRENAALQSQLAEMTERFDSIKSEWESLKSGNGHAGMPLADGLVALSEEERQQMVAQIDTAIKMIDRYLEEA